jgi:hypothetical protein
MDYSSTEYEDFMEHPTWLHSVGTYVVTLVDLTNDIGRVLHPRGAVGVLVRQGLNPPDSYRVRFVDGYETWLREHELMPISSVSSREIDPADPVDELFDRAILRSLTGSHAYKLADTESRIEHRGVYLAKGTSYWSLFGVPEQIERHSERESFLELQRFMVMALKAQPPALECLFSPTLETFSEVGEQLVAIRSCFLSKLVFNTYHEYVSSQFSRLFATLRRGREIPWKRLMHLVRLLFSGVSTLKTSEVLVDMSDYLDDLMPIRHGEVGLEEVDRLRLELQRAFRYEFERTKLPDRPNYAEANKVLLAARYSALKD